MRFVTLSFCLAVIGGVHAQDWKWATAPRVWAITQNSDCACPPGCVCAATGKCDCGQPAVKSQEMPKPDQHPARLILTVPNQSSVWVQGQPMGEGGTVREFEVPPLRNGKQYEYTIRVRDAFGTEETRKVTITAGETRRENFRDPARLPAMQFYDPMTVNQDLRLGGGRRSARCVGGS